jgi:hypothetical protein
MKQLITTLATTTASTCSAELTLDTETVITLDVKLKSGTHNNSRIVLQHSPDGINWLPGEDSTNGTGSVTTVLATTKVRACVLRGEGSVAEADIFITAK